MYVLCDPMKTLDNCYWFNCSYVDALKLFFTRTDAKEVVVFRDVRNNGSLKSLQFIAIFKRKNLAKFF